MSSPRTTPTGSLAASREWEPEIGEIVAVRTAANLWLQKVVVSRGGHDFPCWNVVWEGRDAETWTPWPIEDVHPLSEYREAMTRAAYFDSLGSL